APRTISPAEAPSPVSTHSVGVPDSLMSDHVSPGAPTTTTSPVLASGTVSSSVVPSPRSDHNMALPRKSTTNPNTAHAKRRPDDSVMGWRVVRSAGGWLEVARALPEPCRAGALPPAAMPPANAPRARAVPPARCLRPVRHVHGTSACEESPCRSPAYRGWLG